MKLSILLIFVIVFCFQQEIVGGKDKYIWRVADGWQKDYSEDWKNYLLGVCQAQYYKKDSMTDVATRISDQINRETNGTQYIVLIYKDNKGGANIYSSKTITFYYDKRTFFLCQRF